MPYFKSKIVLLVIVACLIVVYFVVSQKLNLAAHFENRYDYESSSSKENSLPVAKDPQFRLLIENVDKLSAILKKLEIINVNTENNKIDGSVDSKSVEPLQTAGSYDFNRGTPTDPDVLEKRNTIKEMMQFAWDGYKKYAWGASEIRPVSKQRRNPGFFGESDIGATIIDSLDTLYLMGMIKEFDEGRAWARSLQFNDDHDLSVFETNIRFIGGLLSAYALSNDVTMLNKAREIADLIIPVFDTPTGIPYPSFNPFTKKASGPTKTNLAELGTLHLEFATLTKYTGDPKYLEKVMKTRDYIEKTDKTNGLYSNIINLNTGSWGFPPESSLGAQADSFYEYLLKSWILSGKKDTTARLMYDEAVKVLEENIITTSPGGLVYAGDLKYGILMPRMQHLACFSGGMFALGSEGSSDPEHYMKLGADITKTCHESYDRSPSKLGPEFFGFTMGEEASYKYQRARHYMLRPEVIESYFYMWRPTKEQKYRDWGWEATQALLKHCKTEGGFSGLKDVYQNNPVKDDVQQSFFLAETLKYLYLLFSEDDLVNLNEWVFNTEAHPLPIST